MKRRTREKLRAYWTPEKRALARMAAAEKEDLPVPVLAESTDAEVRPAFQQAGGEVREGNEYQDVTRDRPRSTPENETDSRGGQKVLVVVRVPFNPRMVECAGESGCENVLVHVGRNGMFAIGDLLFAKPLKGQEGCFEFVGMVNAGLRVDHVGLPLDRRRWEERV